MSVLLLQEEKLLDAPVDIVARIVPGIAGIMLSLVNCLPRVTGHLTPTLSVSDHVSVRYLV